MELTLDNLIRFCKEYSMLCKELNENSLITDMDLFGDDVVDFLNILVEKFNVSFENFDFKSFFLDESEIINCLKILPGKQRKIKDELSVKMLYNYMCENKRSGNECSND